jgi:hypothetical protein
VQTLISILALVDSYLAFLLFCVLSQELGYYYARFEPSAFSLQPSAFP